MVAAEDAAAVQAQIEALQTEMKILELKAQLAALQAPSTPTVADPSPLTITAPVIPTAPVVPTAPPVFPTAPVPVPVVPAAPAIQLAPPVASIAPAAIDSATVTPAAVVASTASNDLLSTVSHAIPTFAAIAIGVPALYFGGTKAVEFINARYEEITGEDGNAAVPPPGAPPSFAPPSMGNVVANKMWAERRAEQEANRAMSWDEPTATTGTRSAPEIFTNGLENLAQEPFGWFFGTASALYSNLPKAPPAESAGRSPIAVAASAAVPDYVGLPNLMEPPPAAAPSAPAGFAASSAQGRVVPSGSKATRNERRRAERKAKRSAERVPPSNPEEIDLARRGEWAYGQKDAS